jgi:hypothetical protein
MGLSFLNKKTWHPGSFANIEKVWIAEQKRREQERKIIENSKKLKEERQIEELKKLQVEAGLIPSSHLDRLDWIYQGPESNSNITTAEEVLLGKPLKDERGQYKRPIIPVFQESYSNPQNEIFTKIHEDPLFVLKKEEMKARKEIEENPYRMKMLLKEIEENIANNQKKEKKNKKKDKKEKKEKKKSRKRSYSRSKSNSSYSRGSKDKRKHSHRNEKHHDEKKSSKEITTTNMLKSKLQGSTQNFGLLDGTGKKISLSGNDLGPDEKLYKNRKELAEKESEFRQPKRDNSYRNLSEKDKERMRQEMEDRAKKLDNEKIKYLEEKTKNIRETSKSNIEKLNLTNESKNISLLNKPGFLQSIDKDVYMSGDLKLDDRIKRNKVNMEREKY